MREETVARFPRPGSWTLAGYILQKDFSRINCVGDVLKHAIVYHDSETHWILRGMNIRAVTEFAQEAFKIIRDARNQEKKGVSALVIREEACGGQLSGFWE